MKGGVHMCQYLFDEQREDDYYFNGGPHPHSDLSESLIKQFKTNVVQVTKEYEKERAKEAEEERLASKIASRINSFHLF